METTQVRLLRNAMSAYAQRRRAASSNLANIDTPGYDRMSVSFEEELQDVRRHSGSLREQSEVEPDTEVEDEAPVLEEELMPDAHADGLPGPYRALRPHENRHYRKRAVATALPAPLSPRSNPCPCRSETSFSPR